MTVCIQDAATHQYFQRPFTWVADRAAAYNFVTSLEARDYCIQINHGRKVQVVLGFEESRDDVCLFSGESTTKE